MKIINSNSISEMSIKNINENLETQLFIFIGWRLDRIHILMDISEFMILYWFVLCKVWSNGKNRREVVYIRTKMVYSNL